MSKKISTIEELTDSAVAQWVREGEPVFRETISMKLNATACRS
jgi:hypothetical protein